MTMARAMYEYPYYTTLSYSTGAGGDKSSPLLWLCKSVVPLLEPSPSASLPTAVTVHPLSFNLMMSAYTRESVADMIFVTDQPSRRPRMSASSY